MTQQTTIDMLRAMRMSAMAAELEKQLGDPAFRELGFEDRLGLLVNAESGQVSAPVTGYSITA
jgi:hypothetical protein